MAKSVGVRVGVVLAGGVGERFWPLSRRERPKQLLKLTPSGHTLLEESIQRIRPLISPEHLYVVTGKQLLEPIRRASVGLPDANILAEPAKRNTTGALSYAAAFLLAKYGLPAEEITMAVLTSDHLVGEEDVFCKAVSVAMDASEREDALATLGIAPTRPETGYGYIQAHEQIAAYSECPVYRVSAFHEKPNRDKAGDFVAAKTYLWNSGMFFWKLSTFLRELGSARPALVKSIMDMTDAFRSDDVRRVEDIFEGFEDISIDYALMEHAKNVIVVRANFPWDDMGSWSSLERFHEKDGDGNVRVGDAIVLDSHGCIVYNDVAPDEMAVALVGIDDVAVIVTKDAVLVVSKDRVQDVRKVVQELSRRGSCQR